MQSESIMKMPRRSLVFIFFIVILSFQTVAQHTVPTDSAGGITKKLYFQSKEDSANASKKIRFGYGSKGWEFEFDDKFLMRLQWRLQFRMEFQSRNPLFFIPEEDALNGSFNIQRARLKVGGYAYNPWLKWYLEYDFPSGYLLNWEFTIAKRKGIQLRLGQWKLRFNSERYISSGKQQVVERSISNRYFTFDRQIGVLAQGTLWEGRKGCSSYFVGLFNGNGRMARNDDGKFMFFARYQWNFSRKVMTMTYGDLLRVQKPEGFIAFNYAHNKSAYTRFSSDGGGNLPGYDIGEKQQYLLNQYNLEFFFKYKGFSFSNENHIKNIYDDLLKQRSEIYGGYVMAGYFFSEILDFMPEKLEIIARYALVNNVAFFDIPIHEYSIGANWFFSGHRNKLTADFSYIQSQDFIDAEANYRFRLPCDVSF